MSAQLLDPGAVAEAIAGLVESIGQASAGEAPCFVAIARGGVPLAKRLVDRLAPGAPVGVLDITLYRDDLAAHPVPQVGPTRIDFPIADRPVILVDDVLYTGRTVRAALEELKDFGRPRWVRLAVLVERPGRELPIRADFVGRHVEAAAGDRVEVRLSESGERDEVVLLQQR
jgi:pyrimidine operon attenuation protein/uracil phosphoribosyltransferase